MEVPLDIIEVKRILKKKIEEEGTRSTPLSISPSMSTSNYKNTDETYKNLLDKYFENISK